MMNNLTHASILIKTTYVKTFSLNPFQNEKRNFRIHHFEEGIGNHNFHTLVSSVSLQDYFVLFIILSLSLTL